MRAPRTGSGDTDGTPERRPAERRPAGVRAHEVIAAVPQLRATHEVAPWDVVAPAGHRYVDAARS